MDFRFPTTAERKEMLRMQRRGHFARIAEVQKRLIVARRRVSFGIDPVGNRMNIASFKRLIAMHNAHITNIGRELATMR